MTIYFEDFVVGHVFEFGDVVMTEEEIIEFATRYDQSGWHCRDEHEWRRDVRPATKHVSS